MTMVGCGKSPTAHTCRTEICRRHTYSLLSRAQNIAALCPVCHGTPTSAKCVQ